MRLKAGLKELVDDYLAVEKRWTGESRPDPAGKLFLRGIGLCENLEGPKFIRKIDPIQVRRAMKQANPELFEEFLERIVA